MGALLHIADLGLRALVEPVRGNAGLGDPVHRMRADLDFDRHAVGADQRRVQRLVAVDLGDGDVVLELAGHRLVQAVQRAEREIAGRCVADRDPDAVDVEHLGEGQMLFGHFLVDRVEVLFPAGNRGLDTGLGQSLADPVKNAVHTLPPVAARRANRLGEHLVAQRVQMPECEFLDLAVKAVQAEAVGDRGVDLQRLARDPPPLFRADRIERAHVVQAIGQLDQHDAHVARHREQHLAEVFRLGVLLGLELDAVELGHPVDEVRHRASETL